LALAALGGVRVGAKLPLPGPIVVDRLEKAV
jgi:hypothetical protein